MSSDKSMLRSWLEYVPLRGMPILAVQMLEKDRHMVMLHANFLKAGRGDHVGYMQKQVVQFKLRQHNTDHKINYETEPCWSPYWIVLITIHPMNE